MAEIATLMGFEPYPWQRYVLDVALEIQSEEAGDPFPGQWAYDDVVVTAPRRAGKTVIVQPVIVHRAELIKRARIVMTAQSGIYASQRWADVSEALEESAYLKDRVSRRTTIGREELRWVKTKSTLTPFSPKARAIHGGEPDLVLIDEFWEFDAEQGNDLEQAIRPTFLTHSGQMWRYSTAGKLGESAWYNLARRRGRGAVQAGENRDRFYIEWSVPEEVDGGPVEDLDTDELLQVVIENHPLRDHPRTVAFIRRELEDADTEEKLLSWLRAYGNHTIVDVSRKPIASADAVARALTTEQIPQDPDVSVGLGVDVDPDGRQAAISAVLRRGDGKAISSVIRCELGTRWAAAEVVGIWERQLNRIPHVAVNDTTYTRDIADQIERAGVPVLRLNLKDYAAACGRHHGELTGVDEAKRPAPTLLHRGHAAFITAVQDAQWVKAGEGRKYAARIEPIPALTSGALALWAYDHLPEPEEQLGPFKIH